MFNIVTPLHPVNHFSLAKNSPIFSFSTMCMIISSKVVLPILDSL